MSKHKSNTLVIPVAKPRNPLVVLARTKKAGAQGLKTKELRRKHTNDALKKSYDTDLEF